MLPHRRCPIPAVQLALCCHAIWGGTWAGNLCRTLCSTPHTFSAPSDYVCDQPDEHHSKFAQVTHRSPDQLLLQVVGNQWTTDSLRLVLLVAMGLSLFPAAVSMLFDDRQALGSLSEGLLASPELQQAVAGGSTR